MNIEDWSIGEYALVRANGLRMEVAKSGSGN